MSVDYNIRKITLEDSVEVIDLIQESLKEAEIFFLPVLPTKKTSYHFYKLEIEPAIINGDPCYLVSDGEKHVGFNCASTCINQVYDFDKKVGLGILTFILKEYRRKGLSERLRNLIMKDLKTMGVEYVFCDIYEANKPSLLGMKKICKESNLKPERIFERYGCRL